MPDSRPPTPADPPQATGDGPGPSILGPRNLAVEAQNPDAVAARDTDSG